MNNTQRTIAGAAALALIADAVYWREPVLRWMGRGNHADPAPKAQRNATGVPAATTNRGRPASVALREMLEKGELPKITPLLSTLEDSELKQYFRRTTAEGELKALQ